MVHNRKLEGYLDRVAEWDSPDVGVHYLRNIVGEEGKEHLATQLRLGRRQMWYAQQDSLQDFALGGILGVCGLGYEVGSWFSSQQDPSEVLTYGMTGLGVSIALMSYQNYLHARRRQKGYDALLQKDSS